MKLSETTMAGIDCLSGKAVKYDLSSGEYSALPAGEVAAALPFVGPGLVDLQVNGIAGIDFNDSSLTEEGILTATKHLLSHGITSFLPTIVTNAEDQTCRLLATIARACARHPLLRACMAGFHLEGPFISKADGARGAHHEQFVRQPDWELLQRFQQSAENQIKVITLSPEWSNAPEFIRACRKSGILVSIGHSAASPEQIQKAVEAGASLSTHIGNAIPLMLPRHPNIIWEQLAHDELHTSVIADGFHVPDSFLKVVMRAKGKKCFLVSDATSFSGMKPGIYQTHIGGKVLLEANGRLSIVEGSGLLAGATLSLLQNVEYLVNSKLATLKSAWEMASVLPRNLINGRRKSRDKKAFQDTVVFRLEDKRIHIIAVYKAGKTVYQGKK